MRRVCPVTTLFCALCLAVALGAWCLGALPALSGLEGRFALQAPAVAAGETWRLVGYALVHGAWWHLGLNVVGIWLSGRWLEQALGSARLGWVIILSAAAGALGFFLTVAIDPRLPLQSRCVGASGVLAALLALPALWQPKAWLRLWCCGVPLRVRAWVPAALVLGMSALECAFWPQHSAYGAHALGALCGLLCGLGCPRAQVD